MIFLNIFYNSDIVPLQSLLQLLLKGFGDSKLRRIAQLLLQIGTAFHVFQGILLAFAQHRLATEHAGAALQLTLAAAATATGRIAAAIIHIQVGTASPDQAGSSV